MMNGVIDGLLWFSALGCGLMAGVYFAFSTFIMTALGGMAPSAGVAAMNGINRDILRSLFMPFFFGTTLAALALVAFAILMIRPGALAMGLGGILYVVGMFGVTMLRNVPLNNALAADEAVWPRYLGEWTFWNHVRTLSCLLSTALFILALVAD